MSCTVLMHSVKALTATVNSSFFSTECRSSKGQTSFSKSLWTCRKLKIFFKVTTRTQTGFFVHNIIFPSLISGVVMGLQNFLLENLLFTPARCVYVFWATSSLYGSMTSLQLRRETRRPSAARCKLWKSHLSCRWTFEYISVHVGTSAAISKHFKKKRPVPQIQHSTLTSATKMRQELVNIMALNLLKVHNICERLISHNCLFALQMQSGGSLTGSLVF